MNSALILITKKKALKKLAKMPSEDEMAREVAKRELMLAVEKKKCKGQSFQSETNCLKKKVYIEESSDDEVEESSGKEEYIKKKKRKQRKCPKKCKKEESSSNDEESSEDEKPKTNKEKEATTYHKNNLKSQNTLAKNQSSFSSLRANITS